MHLSHNAQHHRNRNMHISFRNWCIVGYWTEICTFLFQSVVFVDFGQVRIVICEIDLWNSDIFLTFLINTSHSSTWYWVVGWLLCVQYHVHVALRSCPPFCKQFVLHTLVVYKQFVLHTHDVMGLGRTNMQELCMLSECNYEIYCSFLTGIVHERHI